MDGWNEVGAALANLLPPEFEPYYETRVRPFEEVATFGTIPAATTAEGAAAALRKVLAFDDMEQQDTNLVRAALAYLERGAA